VTKAFVFDASACTGCKACQAACKDKNNLPIGVLWRRVYEISGGSWQHNGSSWINNVFAYNFSIACNHCTHPKCAGVCPVNAYNVRTDGIVILDSSKCIGCGYCNWACPYSVPQYDHEAGVMTKCDFCFDSIDSGDAPACVKACPMRVLEFAENIDDEITRPGMALWEVPASAHPFPLPNYSRTEPHVLLRVHPGMTVDAEKRVANLEEVKPADAKSELPLIFFGLLIQMGIGAFWASQWILMPLYESNKSSPFFVSLMTNMVIGFCVITGTLASFFHLGLKRNAWRVLANLRKSWLSKEILFLGFFSAAWLSWIVTQTSFLGWLASFTGFGFIYSMWNVYRLRSMPVWNRHKTLFAFLISAILLGHWVLVPVMLIQSRLLGIHIPGVYIGWIAFLSIPFLVGEIVIFLQDYRFKTNILGKLRFGLIILVSGSMIVIAFTPESIWVWLGIALFIGLFVEELIGRWSFYDELVQRIL